MRCIARADKIVVMDRGRIVQEGAHGDLLQTADGRYARLYRESGLLDAGPWG